MGASSAPLICSRRRFHLKEKGELVRAAVIFFSALFASVALATAADTSAVPEPYRIFANAQRTWALQHYPAIVGYVVHVHAVMNGKVEDRRYASQWYASGNFIVVDPVSAEQKTDPYIPPPGFDVSAFGGDIGHIGGPSAGTGTNGDLIGIPQLAPNYGFIAPYVTPKKQTPAEIVEEIRAQYNDPASSAVSSLQQKYPPTIANVFSAAMYRISLVGLDQVGDHIDYHLSLTPLANPSLHRLRDVWVDRTTYRLDKLRVSGNFLDRATSKVPWVVTFQNVGGVEYIASEATEKPMQHWYDFVSLSFEDVHVDEKPSLEYNHVYTYIREPQL